MPDIFAQQRVSLEEVSFRESIIGFDSRVEVTNTTDFPFSTVTHIRSDFPGGFSAIGSGTMISDTLLVTAAHVVFDTRFGGLADITATPGRSLDFMPFGQSGAADIWVPDTFIATDTQQYDFAIIELEEPLGAQTGHMNFAGSDGVGLFGTDIQVTGFPADLNFGGPRMFTAVDEAAETVGNVLRHYADTTGGMSGGPIVRLDDEGEPLLTAIHTNGGGGFFPNSGVRITDEIASILDTAINQGLDALRGIVPPVENPEQLPPLSLAEQVRAAFDEGFYLADNPDVAAAVDAGRMTAFQHYQTWGWAEGRDPNASFDTSFYLTENPDVAAAGMEPLFHFIAHGEGEGRSPNPSAVLARQNEDALEALDEAILAELSADSVPQSSAAEPAELLDLPDTSGAFARAEDLLDAA